MFIYISSNDAALIKLGVAVGQTYREEINIPPSQFTVGFNGARFLEQCAIISDTLVFTSK